MIKDELKNRIRMALKDPILQHELKNRIRMALKDPILQYGFDIICEENAEVKHIADFMDNKYFHLRRYKERLLKAKEIMRIGIEGTKREFIFFAGRYRPFAEEAKVMLNDFVVKAEQFLKEEN